MRIFLYVVILQAMVISSMSSESSVTDQKPDNGQWCPVQCDCFNYFKTVDCSRRGLTKLPVFSYITRRLYLEGDLIEDLPPAFFTRTRNLSVIILENNHIRFIDTQVFCGLPYLQEINLSTNLLQSFNVFTPPNAQNNKNDSNIEHQRDGNRNKNDTIPEITKRDTDYRSTLATGTKTENTAKDLDRSINDSKIKITRVDKNIENHTKPGDGVTRIPPRMDKARDSGYMGVDGRGFVYESYDYTKATTSATTSNDLATQSTSDVKIEETVTEFVPSEDQSDYCRSTALKEINLSHNSLRKIPTNLSYFAPSLEILNLAFNEIISAALDPSFSSLTALRYLDLRRNDIREIRRSDFDPIRKLSLETISLADCGLVRIDPEAFRDMGNLTSLTLSRSLVNQSALERAFSVFSPEKNQLIRLDVSETYIRNLTVSLVGRFSKLVSLFVSYCDLESVEPDVFKRLPDLETLHLEGGQLTQLENITSLKKLRRLNAKMNRLTDISLSELTSLESVDLSYNQLDRLKVGWIGGGGSAEDIQLLNLSHNRISYISPGVFDRQNVITTLDLSYNRMLDFPNLGSLKVSKLDLSHNGMRTIPLGSLDTLHQTLNELDLSYNDLALFSDQTFLDFHLLQYLSLAHNRLGESLRNSQTGNLFDSLQLVQVLDLSHNAITVIPGQALAALHHLNTLYLQGNMIRDLADVAIDRTRVLAKLVCSSNRLHAVDTNILLQLNYLEEIDLSSNPFECSCSLMPFLRWANTTMVTILEAQGGGEKPMYYCDFPPGEVGKSIFQRGSYFKDCEQNPPSAQSTGSLALKAGESSREMDANTKQNSNILTVIVALICTVAGLAGVGMICYFGQIKQRIDNMRYRWQIRYLEVSAMETSLDHKL